MSAGILGEIVAGHLRGIPRMNVQQFEKYMASGAVAENIRCELLDGYPVIRDSAATGEDPMIMGHRHALVVNALTSRLVMALAGSNWSVNCQTPIYLNSFNRVEPDLTIIRGRSADYAPNYPSPAEVALIIEISDSSVEADRITKLEKYALEGIAVYWIVNLREERIEIYELPEGEHGSYTKCRIYYDNQAVELSITGIATQTLSVKCILDGTV